MEEVNRLTNTFTYTHTHTHTFVYFTPRFADKKPRLWRSHLPGLAGGQEEPEEGCRLVSLPQAGWQSGLLAAAPQRPPQTPLKHKTVETLIPPSLFIYIVYYRILREGPPYVQFSLPQTNENSLLISLIQTFGALGKLLSNSTAIHDNR